jgi:hypothetical protein
MEPWGFAILPAKIIECGKRFFLWAKGYSHNRRGITQRPVNVIKQSGQELWVWVACEARHKLIPVLQVGPRTQER